MKSSINEIPTIIGTKFGNTGYYFGRVRVEQDPYALFLPTKALGDKAPSMWNKSMKEVKGATSYCDGMANTIAMAEAGSELAQWLLDLVIDGEKGCYLGAQDEVELQYRNLKPGTDKNWLYARSGINVSALIPTYPYTADLPLQTNAELFQKGGSEAFEESAYWSSTQHPGGSGYACGQHFYHGIQYWSHKSNQLRARAVRRLAI